MTRMTPALARLLVEEHEQETEQRRRRRAAEQQASQVSAPEKAVSLVRVPQQRTGVRLPPG